MNKLKAFNREATFASAGFGLRTANGHQDDDALFKAEAGPESLLKVDLSSDPKGEPPAFHKLLWNHSVVMLVHGHKL